jgi:BolA protein
MSIHERIRAALGSLPTEHLELVNESHMHSRGEDTHFKAIIVSPEFAGLNALKRHRKVYATLGELMGEFHALALHTYTPEEWAEQGAAPDSPSCRGGSKHEH